MPVLAQSSNPPLAYHTLDRPAAYGFMRHNINEVQEQVYSELRAERARNLSTQRSRSGSYGYRPRQREPNYTSRPERSSGRNSGRPSTSRVAFPTPETYPITAGAPYTFPVPNVPAASNSYSAVPQSRRERRVRIQSPHSYEPYTPIVAHTDRMRMPEPVPYGPIIPPSRSAPRTYQRPSQVRPFPETRESAPLLSARSHSRPIPPSFRDAAGAHNYGVIPTQSSRVPPRYHSSHTQAAPMYYAPSALGSSTASTYGSTYTTSTSASTSTYSSISALQKGRSKLAALQKALESMQTFKLVTEGWLVVIRRNRGEKLLKEEKEISSLVKGIHQRAEVAISTMSVISATLRADEGLRDGAPFGSEKMAANTAGLASLGTSLHQKLGSLVRRLKEVESKGTSQESSPGCCSPNLPGCLAGLYLKKKFLLFTSVLKAYKDNSEYDSQESERLVRNEHSRSHLLDALYREVQGMYNTAIKALAGFESSLRTFQLALQSRRNTTYYYS